MHARNVPEAQRDGNEGGWQLFRCLADAEDWADNLPPRPSTGWATLKQHRQKCLADVARCRAVGNASRAVALEQEAEDAERWAQAEDAEQLAHRRLRRMRKFVDLARRIS